jgi:hypothetical protein
MIDISVATSSCFLLTKIIASSVYKDSPSRVCLPVGVSALHLQWAPQADIVGYLSPANQVPTFKVESRSHD